MKGRGKGCGFVSVSAILSPIEDLVISAASKCDCDLIVILKCLLNNVGEVTGTLEARA